jgi:hypothetical protein
MVDHMTIVKEKIHILTPLAKIRRKGVRIRTYEDTDSFVNVAPWTATDFADCGEERVMYFAQQNDLPRIAIHGDHIHVLIRDTHTWELVHIDENEAKDIVKRFKTFLKDKGIKIEEELEIEFEQK